MKVILVNGPNLNLLGEREREHYGGRSLAGIVARLERLAKELNTTLVSLQSNSEGELIDFIHEHSDASGGIVNAGAYAHTSIAIRDAFLGTRLRFVEVHLSNLYARELFRQKTYLGDVAEGVVMGLGAYGYEVALRYFASNQK